VWRDPGRVYVPTTYQRRLTVSGVDKVKDKLQSTKGKVKKETGKATNDPELEAEGKVDEVSGNLKQAGEKVKDAFREGRPD
jgi:uncharacterized protein YjbJ (UPF0337 family)